MKKTLISTSLALILALGLATVSFAQSMPSSKSAVQVADLILVPYKSVSQGWTPILSTSLKTSQQKDLVMGVSLVTGLFTRTLVKSKNLTLDQSTATAGIEVRVLIDEGTAAERVAYPGIVDFDKRMQDLQAKFAGYLSSCTDQNGDGTVTIPTECTILDEELQLILETLGAHHFNFVLDQLGAGIHTVEVQARIFIATAFDTGAAEAKALIGKGSLTVEEIRLIKGADIIIQ